MYTLLHSSKMVGVTLLAFLCLAVGVSIMALTCVPSDQVAPELKNRAVSPADGLVHVTYSFNSTLHRLKKGALCSNEC